MKKALLFIIMLTLSFAAGICHGLTVFAVDNPYIYSAEDQWLLDRDTGEKLFLLPASYYAKLDNIEENYYFVTYNGVQAKIEKDKVSTIGYHTTPKSTICDIQLEEKYRVFTEIRLKKTLGGGESYLVPTSANMIFLGVYPIDEDTTWYYVGYEDKKGYLNPEFTTKAEISFEKFEPEVKESEQNSGIDSSNSDGKKSTIIDSIKNNSLVKILIISGLCLILVVLIILIFVPSKHRKNRYYYEE